MRTLEELDQSVKETLAECIALEAEIAEYRAQHRREILLSGVEGEIDEQRTVAGILPLALVEKRAIAHALVMLDGNMLAAAKYLGIGKTTLYRKIEEFGWKVAWPLKQRNGKIDTVPAAARALAAEIGEKLHAMAPKKEG